MRSTKHFLILRYILLCSIYRTSALLFHPQPQKPVILRRSSALASREPVSDPFRSSQRPSLHPITINVLSSILQKRSCKDSLFDETKAPLELAVAVGKLAVEAMTLRLETSKKDGMEFDVDEQRAIAGRVVGVSMRLENLESELEQSCDETEWIAKYKDWDRFGVSPPSDNRKVETEERIASDALFRLCRAECLLALFLSKVEKPQLELVGESVPDKSAIDFIDEDRKKVLRI